MPTLSLIRLSNKCSYIFTGKVNDIIRMLTQCALEDDLLAEAITQSALIINQDKKTRIYADKFVNRSIGTEVAYFSLNENSSLENPIIQNR